MGYYLLSSLTVEVSLTNPTHTHTHTQMNKSEIITNAISTKVESLLAEIEQTCKTIEEAEWQVQQAKEHLKALRQSRQETRSVLGDLSEGCWDGCSAGVFGVYNYTNSIGEHDVYAADGSPAQALDKHYHTLTKEEVEKVAEVAQDLIDSLD